MKKNNLQKFSGSLQQSLYALQRKLGKKDGFKSQTCIWNMGYQYSMEEEGVNIHCNNVKASKYHEQKEFANNFQQFTVEFVCILEKNS